jgi:hypothetical protein
MTVTKTFESIILVMIIIVTTAATATTTMTTAVAQAQQMVILGGPFSAMDEDTEAFIKDYLVSVIMNNLTSMNVNIQDTGTMTVNNFHETPSDLSDNILISIDNTPFTAENGYKFELGKIMYPNGTQFLPR